MHQTAHIARICFQYPLSDQRVELGRADIRGFEQFGPADFNRMLRKTTADAEVSHQSLQLFERPFAKPVHFSMQQRFIMVGFCQAYTGFSPGLIFLGDFFLHPDYALLYHRFYQGNHFGHPDNTADIGECQDILQLKGFHHHKLAVAEHFSILNILRIHYHPGFTGQFIRRRQGSIHHFAHCT
ncbi:hypothetical protein DSECCO2_250650 [anaerobic digester metagenome]